MELQELQEQAFALVGEGKTLEAAELFYRAYEESVAAIRKAKEASESSVGVKKVLEELEYTDEDHKLVETAMEKVRNAIFDAIKESKVTSVLLHEKLKDYASDEVQLYRKHVINEAGKSMNIDTEAEELDVDIDAETLKTLKSSAEAFFTVAGSPLVTPDDKAPEHSLTSKQLKSGVKLAFSNLPSGVSTTEKSEKSTDSSVKHSQLMYSVGGVTLPAGTVLSTLCLENISSSDWTVTIDELKSAVVKASDYATEYSKLNDEWTVELNGHVIRRWKESRKG